MNANREPRCPSCDASLVASGFRPMQAGLAGYSHEAPLLSALWRFSGDLLDALPEPVLLTEFCQVVADSQAAAPETVRNLLDTARREGLVTYEYRMTGKPRRRRAFILPRRRAEDVA